MWKILGDSGYAIKKYLLTPLLETRNRPEAAYNEAHIRTRVLIENTFGIWKRCFPILACGRRTKLELTMTATAILHNIAGRNLPPNLDDHNEELFQRLLDNGNINAIVNNVNNDGFRVRAQLINNYFA